MEGLGAMSPAERYAAAADNFTRLVGGVSDWDGPSPVKEWTAREVVGVVPPESWRASFKRLSG